MSVDKRMSLVSFHYIDTLATSITYKGWKIMELLIKHLRNVKLLGINSKNLGKPTRIPERYGDNNCMKKLHPVYIKYY